MTSRILVIGARGYVGSHVCRALLDAGHAVTALVRPDQAAPDGLRALSGTLEAAQSWAARCAEFDAVGYFAASPDPRFELVLTSSVAAIVSALSTGQRFAMQAGSLVFGDTADRTLDESAPRRPPPFLAARAAFEDALLRSAGRDGRPACSIVYASLVHGGAGAAIPGVMLAAARRDRRAVSWSQSAIHWSSVHVSDWSALLAATLERGPAEGGAYFAAGPAVSVDDLAAAVAAAAGVPSERVSAEEMAQAYGPFGAALCMNQRFSPQRARDVYGWQPARHDIASSIREVP